MPSLLKTGSEPSHPVSSSTRASITRYQRVAVTQTTAMNGVQNEGCFSNRRV